MNSSRFILYLSILVVILSAYLLITGSELLLIPLFDFGYPSGNLISWVALIAINYISTSLVFKWERGKRTYLKVISVFFLVLAICWGINSYLLAGNIHHTFSGEKHFQGGQGAMKIFWLNSYALVLAPLFIIALSFSLKTFGKGIKKGA